MCSKFFAATKQIEEELLLLLWVFLREKKRKKRNEMRSTKRAKESEERSKEQVSEIEERKKKGNWTFNTILFYLKPMYMKNNVARCIRAVQKRQEVNFNNSFFYTI